MHAATSDPNQAAIPTYIEDHLGTNGLAIDLRPKSPTYGQFSVYVGNQGFYDGVASVRALGPGSVSVLFHKLARYLPVGAARPESVTLLLEGGITTVGAGSSQRQQAKLTVVVGGREYSIVTGQPDPAAAARTVQTVIAFYEKHNWKGLYSLLAPEIQQAITIDEFLSMLTGGPTGVGATKGQPVPTHISLAGHGRVLHQWGYDYYVQPLAVELQSPGGTRHTSKANIYLVREVDKWRFMSTDPVR
jgi:hypothetical protein